MSINTETIKALRELLELAAPRPWLCAYMPVTTATGFPAPVAAWVDNGGPRQVHHDRMTFIHGDDSRLLTEAVNALPDLLDELDQLREQVAEARKYAATTITHIAAERDAQRRTIDELRALVGRNHNNRLFFDADGLYRQSALHSANIAWVEVRDPEGAQS